MKNHMLPFAVFSVKVDIFKAELVLLFSVGYFGSEEPFLKNQTISGETYITDIVASRGQTKSYISIHLETSKLILQSD